MAPGGPPDYKIGDYVSKAFETFTSDIGTWLLIGVAGTFALGCGFWGGFQNCALKAFRGEPVAVGDVFYPFSRFGDFFVFGLVMFAIAFVSVFLLFIPLILFGIWWFFTIPIMIQQNVGWQEAARQSKERTSQAMLMTFVLGVVAQFMGGIGGVVGLTFLTAPLAGLITVAAYMDVFGVPQGAPAGAFPQGQPGAMGAAAAPGGWGQAPAQGGAYANTPPPQGGYQAAPQPGGYQGAPHGGYQGAPQAGQPQQQGYAQPGQAQPGGYQAAPQGGGYPQASQGQAPQGQAPQGQQQGWGQPQQPQQPQGGGWGGQGQQPPQPPGGGWNQGGGQQGGGQQGGGWGG